MDGNFNKGTWPKRSEDGFLSVYTILLNVLYKVKIILLLGTYTNNFQQNAFEILALTWLAYCN